MIQLFTSEEQSASKLINIYVALWTFGFMKE